jgi:hypothetical protein
LLLYYVTIRRPIHLTGNQIQTRPVMVRPNQECGTQKLIADARATSTVGSSDIPATKSRYRQCNRVAAAGNCNDGLV